MIDPERATMNMKKSKAKAGVPTENQQLVTRGKVLTGNVPMKEYGLSGGETIVMTAELLGGTKKKSLSPKTVATDRDKKRKESEPCIEVGDSLEEENAQTHLDIEPSDNARWMEDSLK